MDAIKQYIDSFFMRINLSRDKENKAGILCKFCEFLDGKKKIIIVFVVMKNINFLAD